MDSPDAIIRVSDIGKRYVIRHQADGRPTTLRETLAAWPAAARRLWRRGGWAEDRTREEFWALRNVSFEVKRGEVVGIIGRNGAGKSTLLKVLSRIVEPTEGRVELDGRVASLLEVGTGFHPELTGRENIFLNGAILGMTRAEIRRKFDEIVAFSEIEKFLDTPVKRYSSGMYTRLAFAVAAHLEPEILIVDEVLAVGDVRFQKKCLDKMSDIGAGGRTVLFVSHNMPAVIRLCTRALLLDNGRLLKDALPRETASYYLSSTAVDATRRDWPDAATAPGDDVVRLRGVRILSAAGETEPVLRIDRPIEIEMRYDVLSSGVLLYPAVQLVTHVGVVFQSTNWQFVPLAPGSYRSRVVIPANLLNECTYSVTVGISTPSPHTKRVREADVLSFHVAEPTGARDVASFRALWGGEIPGVVRPQLDWLTDRCCEVHVC